MSIVGNAHLSRVDSDKRIWEGDELGHFSCKSFFDLLINSSEEDTFVPQKIIWKVGVPLKVKKFAWLASWKKVNTCDMRQRRPNLAISPSWCILCKCDNESIDHVLIHCKFAKCIWYKVRREF